MGKYSDLPLLRLSSIGTIEDDGVQFSVHPTRNPSEFYLRDGDGGGDGGNLAATFRTDTCEYPYWHGIWSTITRESWKSQMVDRARKLINEWKARAS